MIPAIRLRSIQELVHGRGIVTLREIQQQLDVSAMTVRRDVARLEAMGLVVRTRGGVMNPHQVGLNTTYAERRGLEAAGKRAIGEAAAAEVEAGDTLFLSGGTTVLALARALPGGRTVSGRPLTVVTNSLLAMPELIDRPGITTIATGGRASPWDRDLVGQLTTATLDALRARKAFIGATGLTEDGVFSAEPERAAIDRAMVTHAAAAYVLADHTKLDRVALERVCALPALTCLITDAPPPAPLARHLDRAGVRVLVATGNGHRDA